MRSASSIPICPRAAKPPLPLPPARPLDHTVSALERHHNAADGGPAMEVAPSLPPTPAAPATTSTPPAFRLGSALLAIFACALTNTVAEVTEKIGATETAHHPTSFPWLGLTAMISPWVWIGIVFTILSFLA